MPRKNPGESTEIIKTLGKLNILNGNRWRGEGLKNISHEEVAKKFNLTIDAQPIKTFGVKLENGKYSGTVGDLADLKIDIGLAFFDHLPERLEVTEGGFTELEFPHEIIYWNK